MPRFRKSLTTNVLDEARARLSHVYDTFDGCVVAFSGGKDSMALLQVIKLALDIKKYLLT